MSETFIGLMSGTSRDAIDAAALDISDSRIILTATHSMPLTDELRALIAAVCDGTGDSLESVMTLSVDLSRAFAECANQLIAKIGHQPRAIGCHGQTVRHRPEKQFTVQLGNGAMIAQLTQSPTVTDFRSADIALRGQGAPLVPAFHRAVFASENENRAVVNIGGIANITILTQDGVVTGFDTGPGNTLLDAWYREHAAGEWDEDGRWSESGTIDESLVERMLADPYFSTAPPKSTGLEYFNRDWLTAFLSGSENPADVQACLRLLTARSIALSIQNAEELIDRVYLCGGGALNGALRRELRSALPGIEIATTETLGIHPKWVEASAFAWLAHRRIEGLPGNIPSVTGAAREAVLGALYLP